MTSTKTPELIREEGQMFGVRVLDDEIRFDPSRSARGRALLDALSGTAITAFLGFLSIQKLDAADADGTLNSFFRILAVCAFCSTAYSVFNAFRTRVTADRTGIHLMSGRRHTTVNWEAIHAIGSFEASSRIYSPSGLAAGFGFSKKPARRWTAGFVTTAQGETIFLPGFVEPVRSTRQTLSDSTNTLEQRLRLLQSFAESRMGRVLAPASAPTHVTTLHSSTPVKTIGFLITQTACVYGSLTWALGRLLYSKMVILAVCANIGNIVWQHRTQQSENAGSPRP